MINMYMCIYNGIFMSDGRYELFELYYNSLLLQFYNVQLKSIGNAKSMFQGGYTEETQTRCFLTFPACFLIPIVFSNLNYIVLIY